MLAIIASTALNMSAQNEQADSTKVKKERTIALWGHVYDSFTKAGVLDTKITLMKEDSTVVDTMTVFNMGQWQATKIDVGYRFYVPARPQKFIIRADHPDYEPCYINYEIKHVARNTYFDAPWHYMKKRPKNYDIDEGMLEGVVVKATKVKVVYKGDTIVYNADAFNLPEGSMLDALIRQLDGVELKDDGRILVNGTQIDELTLNGNDFFRGNNKMLLENLPHYTVQNIQVYHKTTEKSEYLGYDAEKKKYVMDVVLKREYAEGWLANVDIAGGTPFGEKNPIGKKYNDRYIARLFAMRYTDNSRLSFFANTNNVNETRKPGSNGEWTPSNMPTGQRTTREAGADLLIDDSKKRWKESAQFQVNWNRYENSTQTNAEQFFANSNSTYSRSLSNTTHRELTFRGINNFILKKPFSMQNYTEMSYNETFNRSNSMSFSSMSDPAQWGSTRVALDSAFSASLSLEKQSELINRSRNRSRSNGSRLYGGSYTDIDYKLPTGDVLSLTVNGNFTHQKDKDFSQQSIDYLQAEGQNTRQNRHSSLPVDNYHYYFMPKYTIAWLNGVQLAASYRYLQERKENHNDTYRLDRLGGIYEEEAFGILPSTHDSLLLAIDSENTYDRTHLRKEHRIMLVPRYVKETEENYYYLEATLEGYNVREKLHYKSAYTDTTLYQNCYTFSPILEVYIAKDNWARYFNFYYNMEWKTPDLFQKVNVRNDENPLAVRMGNPNLKAPIIHRLQMSVNRRWNEHKTSLNIGYGLRLYLDQISQGYSYNASTGAYTYMPMNVDGNWQTYFWSHFSRNIDNMQRLNLSNYIHGDYSRNVDYARNTTAETGALSHVNNYYLEDRLTLNYRFEDLTLGSQIYGEYRHANNREHTIETINAVNVSYGLNATYNFKKDCFSKWIKGFSLSSDIKMYSRRGYGSKSLNTDDLVWNILITRTFPNPFGKSLGGSITTSLEAFDILHQLSNTSIVINGQGRTETIQNTLPRYVMLHLTYNFAKSPKKRDGK